jgi:hypothetical protein
MIDKSLWRSAASAKRCQLIGTGWRRMNLDSLMGKDLEDTIREGRLCMRKWEKLQWHIILPPTTLRALIGVLVNLLTSMDSQNVRILNSVIIIKLNRWV